MENIFNLYVARFVLTAISQLSPSFNVNTDPAAEGGQLFDDVAVKSRSVLGASIEYTVAEGVFERTHPILHSLKWQIACDSSWCRRNNCQTGGDCNTRTLCFA